MLIVVAVSFLHRSSRRDCFVRASPEIFMYVSIAESTIPAVARA